jgi:hypothetical protein
MRPFLGLLLLSTLSLPAFAADPPRADPPAQHHTRMTWEQRFTQANVAHDGHLTLAEAKGGYVDVARHFDDIDAAHKGYVTEDDIRTWHAKRRAAHRAAKPAEGKRASVPVAERAEPAVPTIKASGEQNMPAATGSPSQQQ